MLGGGFVGSQISKASSVNGLLLFLTTALLDMRGLEVMMEPPWHILIIKNNGTSIWILPPLNVRLSDLRND
jgi:hypothetical protein